MWSMLKNLMARGDDGGGWFKFLPFIILMVMYGLSSFFKNKSKKPPAQRPGSSPTKPPATGKPPMRLPSYARKRNDQTATVPKPQPMQASRPAGQQRTSPTPARPVPRSRPVARDPGKALEPVKPKPPMPRPAATQAERPKPVRRPATSDAKPETQTVRHIQRERKPRTTDPHTKPARTSSSAKTAARALHARHRHVSRPEVVTVKSLTATERLAKRTSGKGVLAQAILYGEILGTPMALRPMGSHNYTALGSPGISR